MNYTIIFQCFEIPSILYCQIEMKDLCMNLLTMFWVYTGNYALTIGLPIANSFFLQIFHGNRSMCDILN